MTADREIQDEELMGIAQDPEQAQRLRRSPRTIAATTSLGPDLRDLALHSSGRGGPGGQRCGLEECAAGRSWAGVTPEQVRPANRSGPYVQVDACDPALYARVESRTTGADVRERNGPQPGNAR